ncbi:Phage Tail Collar Domain [Serratia liquefaciens]|uniref:phage tail protein n=1 Tax=Serratia liquefaciens TaxID=614 RepID=UPI00217BE024|nr:phage tail protein [Serratia liquefaciens]CAI1820846.1 Phage Tail Collar Domain [Serratia liquefaciens]
MQKVSSVTETADQNGEFTEGNVAQGVPPTILKAVIFNTWQRELVNTVEGAGLELEPDNHHQVIEAINKLISNAVKQSIPTGVPLPWPSTTVPSGWLICDGSTFNKSQYPQLATAYPSGKLPDLRGEFIRGFDGGRNIDPGRDMLSSQPATLLRTGVMEYYGQDESGVDGASGIGFVNEDSLQQTMPVGAKSPVGNLQPSSGTLNDNAMIGKTSTAWIAEGSRWVGLRPRNIAFNYIVRAA